MSTYFSTFEDAKNYAIVAAGVDPVTVELTEDPELKVQPALGFLDSDTPEGKEKIQKDLDSQRGFRLKNANGIEVEIVVAPFRDGFCVWFVDLKSGYAIRV